MATGRAGRRRGCLGWAAAPWALPSPPQQRRKQVLSSQPAWRLSNEQRFSHLERAGFLPGLPGAPRGCARWPRGGQSRAGRRAGAGSCPEPFPIRGAGRLGVGSGWLAVRVKSPPGFGASAAVSGALPAGHVGSGAGRGVACVASSHLSGIRCSVAGNSQRIPAPNCSRLSSFSQGLSRCVGDAG